MRIRYSVCLSNILADTLMETYSHQFTFTGVVAALLLSGCGGGGSSSPATSAPPVAVTCANGASDYPACTPLIVGGSTPTAPVPPVVATCTNGASDYPVCTPAIIPADLQLTVPAPPFAIGSQALDAFNYLNDVRVSSGLGKLAYSAELTKGTENHAHYMVVNSASYTDQLQMHFEIAINPGFTGVGPWDRALFAGYASSNVTEDIAVSNTMAGAVQRLLDTVYHRGTLLNQEYRDVGSSVNACPLHGEDCNVINLGYKVPQRNAADFVMVYPKDGQSNVTLSMGSEAPNPFPEIAGADATTLIGYPVTFAAEAHQTLVVTSFTITEAGKTDPLPAWLLTQATDVNHAVRSNEAYLTAKGALKPSTTYNMSFTGSANGKSISKKWSFSTADRQLPSF